MRAALAMIASAAALAYVLGRMRTPTAEPPEEWRDDPAELPAAEPMAAAAPDGAWSLPEPLPDPPATVLGFVVPPVAKWTPPRTAAPYLDTIRQAEQENGLPQNLLARVLYQESRFREDIITGKTRSPAGALGIAQFMPATAKGRGVDPLDPNSAINGAAAYLRELFDRFGDWTQAIAAYNWGQGNVARKGLARAPAETRAYVAQITRDTGLS